MVALEVNYAAALRVPDVRRLTPFQLEALAQAFDALEAKARKVGGAHTRGAEEALRQEYEALDRLMGHILGLTDDDLKKLQVAWKTLEARRTERSSAARPETVKGEESSFRGPPRKKRK